MNIDLLQSREGTVNNTVAQSFIKTFPHFFP